MEGVFDNGCEQLQRDSRQHTPQTNVALNAEGRPLSFLEIKAGDFLRAWLGSIDCAEAVAPIAALIVSGHFSGWAGSESAWAPIRKTMREACVTS